MTANQITATADVLASKIPSDVPFDTYEQARSGWVPLSSAPEWFLAKAICGLTHRRKTELHAFKFIAALAEKISRPLSGFAVDHLVEILPRLREVRNTNKQASANYAAAISLVRERVRPKVLGKAFVHNAPFVAKRHPGVAGELLELYKEWRAADLIKEPLTPYAETVEVLAASDPQKVLQSLQAETRDAVALLLNAVRPDGKAKTMTVETVSSE
jgi:hypothetical protein